MRVQKATLNAVMNVLSFILLLFPAFIVRKAFIDALGNELLGLTALYTSMIGMLSILELGIGSAIVYALYQPFAERNTIKIKGYLNYYAKFYKIIGAIILGVGICMLPFLPLFIKGNLNIMDARIYFLLFLANSVITYFFSYKFSLLIVAQEEYRIAVSMTLAKLGTFALQFVLLKLYPSLYAFLIIQLVINLLFYYILNRLIHKKFAWVFEAKGEIEPSEKRELTKNMKAMFFHKIGGILVFSTDNIIMAYYINLGVVGVFNNYYMIISAFQATILNGLSGITASIGQLLTENNRENAFVVHQRLFFISFWLVSCMVISLWNTINSFILIWLNEEQLLDSLTIGLILVNLYIFLMRGSVDRFKEAGGIFYQDRYAPLIEGAVNIVASLVLVKVMGLSGIFLGTLISNIAVIFWVKPKMVYKYVFHKPLRQYFQLYFKYLLFALIPLFVTHLVTSSLKGSDSTLLFLSNCVLNLVIINGFYWALFHRTPEFSYFKKLVVNSLAASRSRFSFQKGFSRGQ